MKPTYQTLTDARRYYLYALGSGRALGNYTHPRIGILDASGKQANQTTPEAWLDLREAHALTLKIPQAGIGFVHSGLGEDGSRYTFFDADFKPLPTDEAGLKERNALARSEAIKSAKKANEIARKRSLKDGKPFMPMPESEAEGLAYARMTESPEEAEALNARARAWLEETLESLDACFDSKPARMISRSGNGLHIVGYAFDDIPLPGKLELESEEEALRGLAKIEIWD